MVRKMGGRFPGNGARRHFIAGPRVQAAPAGRRWRTRTSGCLWRSACSASARWRPRSRAWRWRCRRTRRWLSWRRWKAQAKRCPPTSSLHPCASLSLHPCTSGAVAPMHKAALEDLEALEGAGDEVSPPASASLPPCTRLFAGMPGPVTGGHVTLREFLRLPLTHRSTTQPTREFKSCQACCSGWTD